MYTIKLSPYAKIFYTEWLLSPTSGIYNLVTDQIFYGNLDIERLKNALVKYIAEHVILNSHIQDINGEPYWVKNSNISELKYLNNPVGHSKLLKYANYNFDLHNGPLYKFIVLRIKDGVYRFIAVLHHIVIDGSSGDEGWFEALSSYYNDERYTTKYSTCDQIELITNLTETLTAKLEQNRAKCKEFWHNQLYGIEGVDLRFLRLYRNNSEGILVEKVNPVEEIRFSYGDAEFAKFSHIKRKYVITPYIYSLCILALLVNRYTSQQRLAISYGIAIKEGVDFIYGAQVNTNFVPYQFDEFTTIVDLFNQSKGFFKSLKQDNVNYSYYPVTDIIQESNKNLLNLHFIQPHFKDKGFAFTGITKVEIPNEFNLDAADPLIFEQALGDTNNRLNYRIRYDRRFISKELLNNFITSYKKLFLEVLDDLVCGNNNKQVSDYQILNQEQYQQIVYGFNQTQSYPQDKTIHELFEEQARKTPNNIAVVYECTTLTYQELNQKANQLANYLCRNYSIDPDDFIALCLDKNEHMLVAMLAVLKAGGAYVPLDPSYPDCRVGYILKDTKTKVVLTNEKYSDRIKAKGVDMIAVDIDWLQKELSKEKALNPQIPMASDNLAYVVYTSGSTGNPKGVLQQHNNVMRLFAATNDWFHFTDKDIWTLFHSYVFDFTVWEIWGALLYGGKLIIPTSEQVKDTDLFFELCHREKVTVLNQTPQAFYQFMSVAAKRFNDNRLSNLRYVIFGGEALNFGSLRTWFSLYGYDRPKLINMYGITEATVHVTYKEITEKDITQSSCIGIAIPDQKLFILDNNLMLLPIGAIGELYIGGSGLARGYLNQQSLAKEKFISNPFQTEQEKTQNINGRLYKTGDLVRMFPDGNLEYIGRNDFQVKVRGYRIELGEIEHVLTSYPDVRQVVVLAKERIVEYGNDKYLIAYYAADKKLDEAKMLTYLATKLPEYMLPKILVYLNKLPLTVNGKLDRKALPEPKFENSDKYVAPHNEQEGLICKAFAKILGIEKIGVNDDFFSMLGGNSIRAIQLTAVLQDNFDVKVADIFNLRTPKKLAEHLCFGRNVLRRKLKQVALSYKKKPIKNRTTTDDQLKNKVERYLEGVHNLQLDYAVQKPIVNVLLTGATGYLGCNILNQLLTLTNYNVFLLIRANSQKEAVERINKKFQFYFDKTLGDVCGSRVFVIQADIEKRNLGLSPQEYQNLATKIDGLIHAAALVKHYGDYKQFYSANVQATINLLELAKLTQAKDFHYISTYSVMNCGFIPNCEEYTYTEDDLPDNLKQWDNVYIQTKLQGEQQVIKYRGMGVNSNIYRVGNLAFMAENHRAQENTKDNAFFNWLKCLFKMQCIAQDLNLVEISQVDLTAQAIVKLFDKKQLDNNTYHVFNPYLFNISNVFIGSNRTLSIKTLTMDQFVDNIARNLSNNIYHDLIVRFLLHQGWLDGWNVGNTTSIRVLQNRTQRILEQLGFTWLPVTKEEFNGYLELLKLSGVNEMTKKEKIFEHLEMIAPFIPANVYWLDINNVVLGGNQRAVEAVGGLSLDDFVGKTPYDFHPHEIAGDIIKHHEEVMKTGEMLSQEESINDLTTNEAKHFKVIIAPLRDDNGKIIGTIATSIETTAEKAAERLKFENELQTTKLQEQENFRKAADQVVHDIRSPLASLLMIVKACNDIPEPERVALREAATGIGDIANNLLSKYKKEDEEVHAKKESRQPVMVSLTLLQLLTDKKYQYQNLPVKFNHDFCQHCNFAFIQVEPVSFKRMMSNLLNNAVDAFEGKVGKVNLKLNVDSKRVKISIQDDGKGMSPDIIDKIKSNISFTSGKKGGNGIGLTQVRETLQRNEGKFEIKSKVGKGTTVILAFNRVASPSWIAEEIKLNKGDTVVILDDDASIHGAWKTRFKDYEKQVHLEHFTLGKEAVNFINSSPDKGKIFLLTDFELLKQELNGLHVIEQTKISRSILVTSHYANYTVRELAAKTGTKILPKQLASEVSITIDEGEVTIGSGEEIAQSVTGGGDLKKVDLIIIDDNKSFADSLALCFRARDKVVDTYYNPQQLLEQVQQYPKDTKICTDHDLRSSMNGVDLAKKLHEDGYTNLYLLSGWDFDKGAIPDYLTVISKSDTDSITQLVE